MRRNPGIALAGLLALAGPAAATIGTIDNVPAATLMLPYFEVDLNNTEGVNTLFSINNSAATAVLAKVVVWSDQSVPVLNFNVYLTGYDVQTINMRDILGLGNVPRTASDGQDPSDTISPQGPLSQDINFASCTQLPFTNPAISSSFREHLQAWLTGRESPATHDCAGAKKNAGGARIARGYITVDTVSSCDIFFPGNWATYGPTLTDQNVLWGDWFIVNPGENFAQGDMLVHIESCPSCFVAGDHTFYGRYNSGTADDAREPLPTTWASRYLNGGPFNGGTSMLIWREGNASTAAYPCALQGPPSWYPLDTKQVLIFDEQEQPALAGDCPGTCPDPITVPNEAQRVSVADDLLSPFNFGWIYLNLQHPDLISAYGDDAAQAWVIVVMDASGRFSVGYDVLQLDNANDPADPIAVP
ncbi:MAG: hypothetical protein QOH06_1894 [Acidobacteriota bacterium]|jgi:hypothetical protein|nr:hypothetical protein [Acidobacteriota bacterium]